MGGPRFSLAAAAATLAALAAVVAGLIVIGSPSRARQRRLDDLRVQDLAKIAGAVDEYWAKRSVLPDTIDSLVSARLLDRIPTDPASGVRYPIQVTGRRSYRLCATFAAPSDTTDQDEYNWYGALYRGRYSWPHGKGERCFDLTAQKPDTVRRPPGIVFEAR